MRPDQTMQWRESCRCRTDLIGERRDGEVDALTIVALALPVERLMLYRNSLRRPSVLEQEQSPAFRPNEASWRDVEGGRRLADRLALAQVNFSAHGLDHFQRARHDLQRLGMSSPSFESLSDPQHCNEVGAGTTTRSRG